MVDHAKVAARRRSGAFLLIAGVFGGTGVSLAAAAAHIAATDALGAASMMLMTHAAAFLGFTAIAAAGERPFGLTFAAVTLGLGVALFSGELSLRTLLDLSLFTMAAPIGGTLIIVGWVGVGLSGLAVWAGLFRPRSTVTGEDA